MYGLLTNVPSRKTRLVVTLCYGSFSRRSGSPAGDPIMKEPAGITTISGQFLHSLKVCPGACCCAAVPLRQQLQRASQRSRDDGPYRSLT
jgi:hypothetical protein